MNLSVKATDTVTMEFRPEASGAEISDASCEGGTIVYNGNSGDAIWDKKSPRFIVSYEQFWNED